VTAAALPDADDDDDGFPDAFDDEPPREWLNEDALAGRVPKKGKAGGDKGGGGFKGRASAAALAAAAADMADAADDDMADDAAAADDDDDDDDDSPPLELMMDADFDDEAPGAADAPPPLISAKRHKRRSERGGGGGALTAEVLRALAEVGAADLIEDAAAASETTDASTRPGYEDVLTQEEVDACPPGHRAGFVAIVGRPNAGKSTLLNALLGRKLSIVTPKAQTTRHRVLGIVTAPTYQAILLDTPGLLRDRGNVLDHRMQAAIGRAQSDADAVVAVVDASVAEGAVIAAATELAARLDRPGAPPALLLLNKTDKLTGDAVNALKAAIKDEGVALPIASASALSGAGVAAAADWAAAQLPESPPLYPRHLVGDAPERFFVAEIVREKIFLQFRDEVPYAATVSVDEYRERAPPAKDYAAVTIHVERDQQKGILIGAGGQALKRLGAAARADVEAFTGRPLFLELSVKVAPKWRSDERAVRQFGY
jgi:GTP-binding protein Era